MRLTHRQLNRTLLDRQGLLVADESLTPEAVDAAVSGPGAAVQPERQGGSAPEPGRVRHGGHWPSSSAWAVQGVRRRRLPVRRPLARAVTDDAGPGTILRRYLTAFGPASAADVTTWSGLTGMAAALDGMDDLVVHEDEVGKRLFDVPNGTIADPDQPAPPRLLGTYDNVWLSHAGRDRVTDPDERKGWVGANGGVAMSLFVDGMLEGLWQVKDGRPVVAVLFRELTRTERAALDDELARVGGPACHPTNAEPS